MPSSVESARRMLALARAVLRARRVAYQPFKLTWILTEACSQRCRTCHLWATDPDPGPDLPTIERVVRANRQLTWLNLSGGDMVERRDAPAILEAVTSGLPDLALLDFPTAGQDTDATLAALEPALDSDVPRIYVTVSLDGPDSVHDSLRGSPGSALRARATLRKLQGIRRRGFSVVAGMTLSRHNVPQHVPDDPLTLLPPDLPLSDIHLNLAHHSSHYYRNPTDVAPPSGAARALIDAVDAGRKRRLSPLAFMERRYWAIARKYLADGDVGGRCGALRGSVYLGADLTLYPCSIFDRPLGNLRDVDYSLNRMGSLADANAALTDVDARRCPGCWSPCEAFPTLLVGLGSPL
jgi:MoaA/NifB/PqqE/SkfB family radical SAM enzyme